jgi:hypothetical protein
MTGLLAACGGGSGEPASTTAPAVQADAADKYVGGWGACYWGPGVNGRASWNHVMTFTKTSATSASLVIKRDTFGSNGTCSGTPTQPTLSATGSINITGQKQIGSDTVDKLDYSITTSTIMIIPANSSFKDIGAVVSTTLKGGDSASSLDSSGYPTALDSIDVLTKQ